MAKKPDKIDVEAQRLVDAGRYQEAAELLNKAGFERVFTLKEGISGWSGENLPLARGK